MTRTVRYSIIGALAVITGLLIWLMGGEGSTVPVAKGKVKYMSSDWSKPYSWSSKDPYGLFIFNDLLKERVVKDSTFSVQRSSHLDSLASHDRIGTYFFIGNEFGLYNEEIDTLFSLVEKGADLVVITGNVTDNFSESFNPGLQFVFDYTQKCKVLSGKEEFEMIYLLQNDTLAYPWKMIWHPDAYNSATKKISTISGHANFISFPLGQGRILIHSTPECFFNYQLTRRDGFRYAHALLNEIDRGKKLYYLEIARLKDKEAEDIFDARQEEKKEGKRDDSYLQFLFQTPALRTALLLTLIGILLFLIFRSRRMRPIVGVLPPKRNMSEIFVTTVASIYRNKENPYSVLQLHKKNFYNTIQKHFYIDLSKRTDHREIHNLASRCGIDEQEITDLLQRLELSESNSCTESFLTETALLKRNFYMKAGVITDRIIARLDDKENVLYRPLWINFPLLLLGIALILWGLFMLVKSNGVGIVMWPVGSVIVLWSLLRLSKPLFKLNAQELSYYPLLGKARNYALTDLIRVEKLSNGFSFHFRDGKTLRVPHSELGGDQRKQLENYLIRNKIIEF